MQPEQEMAGHEHSRVSGQKEGEILQQHSRAFGSTEREAQAITQRHEPGWWGSEGGNLPIGGVGWLLKNTSESLPGSKLGVAF